MKRLLVLVLIVMVACSPEFINPSAPLRSDFEFEAYPGSQWYGRNGEPVPEESEIINAITGPEHCDWESGVILNLGWPLGQDASDSSESRQFFRDPQRVVFPKGSLRAAFDPNVDLPVTAQNTGYQTEFMELWLDPNQDSAAYLRFAEHAERWPRGDDIACG